MDTKVSIKTKTKTMPVQNLFRYINFDSFTNLSQKEAVGAHCLGRNRPSLEVVEVASLP